MVRYNISDEALAEAIKNSTSFRAVLRELGIKQAGGSQSNYKKRAEKLGIDFSHFTGQAHNKGKSGFVKRTSDTILVKRLEGSRAKNYLLKRALLERGRSYTCSKCGQGSVWMGSKLTLDVDHINQDWLDDREENLRFLCPSCHSQFSRNLL